MAKPQAVARKQSQSKRGKQQKADPDTSPNGSEGEVSKYEEELADYLQDRIKPNLNRGAIPLLARSIAKEIAHRDHPNGASEDAEAEDERGGEAEAEPSGEAEAEQSAEGEAQPDFEDEMHELQAELGEDWILRFSVQGDDAWLTAEKDDGSQRVEAPTSSVLLEAVGLLNEGGGRSS